MATATDILPAVETADFTATGARIVFGARGNGRSTVVYNASARAMAWDGVEGATHALGSRHGGYTYAAIKITGRTVQYGVVSEPAVKVKITIGLGTGDADDIETVDAWLIGSLS